MLYRLAIFRGVSFPNKLPKHSIQLNGSTFLDVVPNYKRQKFENFWRFQNWSNQNTQRISLFFYLYIFTTFTISSRLVKILANQKIKSFFAFCGLINFETTISSLIFAFYDSEQPEYFLLLNNMFWELIWKGDTSKNCRSIEHNFKKVKQHENS